MRKRVSRILAVTLATAVTVTAMPSEAEATFRSFDSVPKAVSQAISQAASQKEIRYFPVTLYDYDQETINQAVYQEDKAENPNSRVLRGIYFSNGAPGSSYATWNTWTGLLTTNNTISSTQTSQKGYVYSGLVGSDMQNGNIHFTVPDGGIFDSGDTKTKEVYTNVGLPFVYENGYYTFDASPDHLAGDIDYAGEKTQCALLVAVELVAQTEGYANYDKFYEALGMISNIIRNARTHVAARAEAFAEEYQNDSVIYTMGSGAAYGAAYMESICIFMEMQWLDSSSIHTGEFFHGPFEVTDANRPFMIQISEGSTRELDERALTFLKTYAKRIEVLDAKELGLSTIDASVVDYFNHALFNNVYPIYNHALAVKREHPLTTRRYMWKVEY